MAVKRTRKPRKDWALFLVYYARNHCLATSADLIGATYEAARLRRRSHAEFDRAVEKIRKRQRKKSA